MDKKEKDRIASQKYRSKNRELINQKAIDRYYSKRDEINENRNKQHRESLSKILEGESCEFCGSLINPCYHHIDPSTKSFAISHCPKWALQDELAKCIILCKSCHAKYHLTKFTKEEIRFRKNERSRLWRIKHKGVD